MVRKKVTLLAALAVAITIASAHTTELGISPRFRTDAECKALQQAAEQHLRDTLPAQIQASRDQVAAGVRYNKMPHQP